jgi:hypothetical protein
MPAPECPRCRSRMTEGFVIDNGYGTRTVAEWIEGTPQTSFWTGLKTKGRRKLKVQSWRCDRCGLLESYAPA